jgi:hypothetical protein
VPGKVSVPAAALRTTARQQTQALSTPAVNPHATSPLSLAGVPVLLF